MAGKAAVMRAALLSLSYGDNPTYRTVFGNLERELRRFGIDTIAIVGRTRRRGAADGFWRRIPRGVSGAIGQTLRLGRLLRRERVDAVNLHFPGEFRWYMLGAWLFCRLTGRRFVLTFQDFGNPSLTAPTAIERMLLRLLLRRSHAATAVSAHAAREVEACLGVRPRTILNGVDHAAYAALESAAPRDPYALFVGRLARYKGVDVLLMAWRALAERGLRPRLVLCGPDFNPGHYQGLIRALGLEAQVRWSGTIEAEELKELLKASRLVVLPSRKEAFGMALLEAMACGKPVVASRCGGIPEFVIHGRNGWLVEPEDVDALADALERLWLDADLRSRLGGAARRDSARFDWARAAGAYAEVLRP